MASFDENRAFMKSLFGESPRPSDQQRGLPQPPVQHEPPDGAELIDLPPPDQGAPQVDFQTCLNNRRSRRRFSDSSVTAEELSYLLWATQGVQRATDDGYATFRPVPSAGARHPFETHLAVNNVDTLTAGLYRYLPLSHQLVRTSEASDLPDRLTAAALGQGFVGHCAACFLWSCVPYRGEWRYRHHAHKVALLDAGHIGQNLSLACEAMSLGTCMIGAYDQQAIDALLGLDGVDEFVVYLAPVGRP